MGTHNGKESKDHIMNNAVMHSPEEDNSWESKYPDSLNHLPVLQLDHEYANIVPEFSVTYMFWSCIKLGFSNSVGMLIS
jgi:hypothetical protein